MPLNNFEIPEVQFKNFELNQPLYPPPFLEISPSNSFLDIPGPHPSYTNKSVLPTVHPSKRLRGSESAFHDPSQYQSGSYLHNGQPFVYSSSCDHNLDPYRLSSSSVLNGSHAIINGNPSSSEPTWATKQELPSLQNQVENWCSPSSPLPPLESADTLIQTPPTGNNLLRPLSSQNSGLLDAVLNESHIMKYPRINTSDFLHDSSIAVNLMDASSQLESYGELTSPLGYSSSSLFSEGTPISGNSISEREAITGPNTLLIIYFLLVTFFFERALLI